MHTCFIFISWPTLRLLSFCLRFVGIILVLMKEDQYIFLVSHNMWREVDKYWTYPSCHKTISVTATTIIKVIIAQAVKTFLHDMLPVALVSKPKASSHCCTCEQNMYTDLIWLVIWCLFIRKNMGWWHTFFTRLVKRLNVAGDITRNGHLSVATVLASIYIYKSRTEIAVRKR